MNWTQPLCDCCWRDIAGQGFNPARMITPEVEQCARCGNQTQSGIYMRLNPDALPYAKRDDP